MEVKTKSGFKCNIDENKVKDWRFAKALAKVDSGDESAIIEGLIYAVPFVLGEKGEAELMKHVTDKAGNVPAEQMINEFREIVTLIGNETKKSLPSQE